MTKALLRLGSVAVAGLLLAAGCTSAQPDSRGEPKTTLTIATLTPPQSMDPVVAGGASMPYFQAVYDTLIRRQPDGSLTPSVATEWGYDETKTTLTLSLRDDVTFADGTALDASAVKANLERFKAGGGPESVLLTSVESVEATDATTVVVHLSDPDPALLASLSYAPGLLANPARFADEDPFATVPDGTGPYTIDEDATIVGSQWTFQRREDYWGEQLPFQTVVFLVLEDENAVINGLQTGQVDAATLQGPIDRVLDDPAISLTAQEIDLKLFNIFDRTGKKVPALADQRVRQAVNYALDRQTMVDQILGGRGTATSQMWSPQAPGFVPELDHYYAYDPDRARALLAEAGYADGFSFSLARLPGLVNDALAEAMRDNLADVGIQLVWEDVDQNAFIQRTFYQQEFPGVVLNGGQSVVDWSTYLALVPPGPVSNPQGTVDPQLESLAQTVRSGDAEQAAAAAQQMNRRLVELAWYVPLFRMQYQQAAVRGVRVTPQAGLAVPALYNYQPTP